EIPANGFVHVDEAHRLAIDEQDHVVRHIHGSAKAQQRLPALLALGDVPAYPAVAAETSIGIEDRLAAYAGDLELARVVEAVPLQVAEGLVRLRPSDLAAFDSATADHLSSGIHRKYESAVHPRFDGDRLLPHARVPRDVRDPHRLARLPDLSGQSDARDVRQFARALAIKVELRPGLAPGLCEAQSACFVVDAEEPPALPVLRFANRADHGLERRCDAAGLRNRARYRVLEPKQLLRALASGDAACEAAVSGENSFAVKRRNAGRREKVLRAALVDQSHLEFAEGLARIEQSAVFLPRTVQRLLAELPSRLPDYRRDCFGGITAHTGPGKAVIRILFPIPVARELGDGAKACLAFARPFARLLG